MWISEEPFDPGDTASPNTTSEVDLRIRRPHERRGWLDFLTFSTENYIYMALPDQAGSIETIDLDFTLMSTAERVAESPQLTRYKIEYSDEAASHDSFKKFSFGDAVVEQTSHLKGVFTLGEKPEQFEFTVASPPQTMFGSVTFLDGDGQPVGTAPVFLEVPAD